MCNLAIVLLGDIDPPTCGRGDSAGENKEDVLHEFRADDFSIRSTLLLKLLEDLLASEHLGARLHLWLPDRPLQRDSCTRLRSRYPSLPDSFWFLCGRLCNP